jgi:hypothetical protein
VPSVRLLHRSPPDPGPDPGGGGKGQGPGGKGGKGGGGGRIPVQFGREVLAALMGQPERAHWKACAQTQAQEEAAADAFKAHFAPFDPTLQ